MSDVTSAGNEVMSLAAWRGHLFGEDPTDEPRLRATWRWQEFIKDNPEYHWRPLPEVYQRFVERLPSFSRPSLPDHVHCAVCDRESWLKGLFIAEPMGPLCEGCFRMGWEYVVPGKKGDDRSQQDKGLNKTRKGL